MIIVIGDRDFLFSLVVISYFNGYCVYLAFRRSHCEYWLFYEYCKYLKLVSLLSAHMNACQGRVPPTGLSCSSLNIGPRMNVLAFQELRSQGVKE